MNYYYKKRQNESGFQSVVVFWCFIGIIIILIMSAVTQAVDLTSEIPVTRKAAERNGISAGTPDWYLLLAIRQAESGKAGREFGILNPKANTLELQAAWCAATIMAQHKRYGSPIVDEGYIRSLQQRYCPVGASNDPAGLNKNWLRNVMYWYNKLKAAESKN